MRRNIYYTGISIALFLLMLELTYINSRSLLFLVDGFGLTDKIFAIIGAMAFSMVTILVMRTARKYWMRIAFPIFDALLVFSGFNLKYADNLLANPIAFWLTVFLSIYIAIIMYSLGIINRRNNRNKHNGVQ